MKLHRVSEAAGLLAKAMKKWVMFISIADDRDDLDGLATLREAAQAAPWLASTALLGFAQDIVLDGDGYVICDSEAEVRMLYQQTVGEDGPTETNPYDGPVKIYACVFDPEGDAITENT